MAFPQTPLPVKVEIQAGPAWTDITADVYLRNPITITGGRADEGGKTDAGTCGLTINNRSGKYSARNPLSVLYGVLGRNTPLRVSLPADATYLALDGRDGPETISCPDAAPLGITGDIDIRVDVTARAWRQGGMLATKAQYPGPEQESWGLWVSASGTVRLFWSPTGAFAARIQSVSTVPLPVTRGRLAVRATLDVNNGAGGYTTTFYTAPTIGGTWTQLGDPVIGAATTSIFDGTAPVEIGKPAALTIGAVPGRYHAAELRSGIAGTVVANPNFTIQTPGATSFADTAPAANTWTLQGGALDDREYRFWGEVPAWPPRWDVSGKDIWVPVEAAGILRRLGQGGALRSALYRAITRSVTPAAYWPLEDGRDSTQAASVVPANKPMQISGPVNFAETDGAPQGSNGACGFGAIGKMVGVVNGMTINGGWVVSYWMALDPDWDNAADFGPVLEWRTPSATGAVRWVLVCEPGGAGKISFGAFDAAENDEIVQLGTIDLRGRGAVQVTVVADQNGSSLSVTMYIDGVLDFTTSITDTTGPVTSFFVNNIGGTTIDPKGTMSHILAASFDQAAAVLATVDAGHGYAGEKAGHRVVRLCAEESVPVQTTGNLDNTEAMGPQRPAKLVDLLEECAAADLGTLFEQRDAVALAFRARSIDYNTTPALTLDYQAPGEVAPPLEPIDDDQQVRNDITAQRVGGSSARQVQQDGPLSVQSPPERLPRISWNLRWRSPT